MICHYKTNLSGAFRVYYYINERIARYEHQRTILEIFPHCHYSIYGSYHLPANHSFFGRITGSINYVYTCTHTHELSDRKAENETQHQCITDYGRNHYGVSCSAGINNLASGNLAPQTFIEPIQQVAEFIKEKTGYDVLGKDTLSFIVSILPRIGQIIMEGASSLAVNLFVMIFVLYFMLIGGKKMEAYVNDILPFNEANTQEVIREINMIVRSNAIGIPLLAIIQGGVAMIGYLIFGAPNILLLGFLTCFATIIPMVGTALVWFPVAAYLAISGDWFHAIGLAAYGAIVVSQSDNLIRFILQKKMADTHPLITIFGVVIGLPLFGFMGVIFGPLLLSLFFLFVNMFKKEYLDLRNNLPSR